MAYIRINRFRIRPGAKEALEREAEAFLADNDPATSGLMYILDVFDDAAGPSLGISIWSDRAAFEASGDRWPEVMKAMEPYFDGPATREEYELTVHNLPDRS